MDILKNINTAIFDMDGTLIDSMWVWAKINIDYLAQHKIEVPKNLKESIEDLTFEESANYFREHFNIKDDAQTIMNTWNDMAYDHYRFNVGLKPGAKEYLEFLKSKNIKLALATSNNNNLLETALKKFDIYDMFDFICTTDEVGRGKNFPDIYLYAAKNLNTNPENCIVFEDILPAIKSAKKANMKAVAIEDESSIGYKDLLIKEADYYIKDYKDLLK